MNTDVKFYTHTNTGAPQLTNVWGCLIDVLDACLVNGFGSQTVSSLISEDGIATAVFGSQHNFKQGQVVKIVGASPSVFNGEFRILSVPNTSSICFKLQENSTLSATGIITCSLPSLGWEKTYSDTQKAVYRADNGLDPMFLRVDDSCSAGAPVAGAKFAKITVCDAMSGIDSFDGVQMPFDISNPDKNHTLNGSVHGWFKWYHSTLRNGSNTNFIETGVPTEGVRDWIIVGDKEFFVLLNRTNMQENLFFTYGFGKVTDLISGSDNYALLVSNAAINTGSVVWHQIVDPISGSRSDYRANTFVFFDKNHAANYQQVQKYEMPFVSSTTTAVNGIGHQQYSGRGDSLESFSTLGKYIGFDIFAISQNLPCFKLPFIKSLAQLASHLQYQEDSVCILSNRQENNQVGYLISLTER